MLQIFGTIIADLFLTIGPLLPSFNGTLPKLLIEPAAIGIGLGIASAFLFFPQSTSHIVLAGTEGLLVLSKRPLEITLNSLTADEDDLSLEDLQKLKGKIIAAFKQIEPALAFLPLDFSVGRWNAEDVKSLKGPVRQAIISSMSLLEFHIARVGGNARMEKVKAASGEEEELKVNADEKTPRRAGQRQLMEHAELLQAIQSPEGNAVRSETVDTLKKSSTGILSSCQDAMTTAVDCVHTANSGRGFGRPKNDQLIERARSVSATLASARTSFANETTQLLLQTHADVFDAEGKLKSDHDLAGHSVRGIMTGMIFEEHVIGVADALEKLLSHLITLLQERQRTKLWFPKSIRYAAAWVFRKKAAAPITGPSQGVDPDDAESQPKNAQKQLRISRGYQGKRRSGLGKAILGTYHWLISAEGMYALRMVVVTVALGIPAVIPSSAGFYFREKGLWGLIMGQTAIVVYMTDFTFSAICRTVGTVIGGVMGLVAWYIGSGNGPGNPYGLAAIMLAAIVILMWARLFFPPALLQASIISAATCVLVVGYSYDDT